MTEPQIARMRTLNQALSGEEECAAGSREGDGAKASGGQGNGHSSPGAHSGGPEVDCIGHGFLLVEYLHFLLFLPELLGLTLFVGKAPDCRHG